MHRAANVLAHGIDLVDVHRFQSMVEEHADRFLDRVFTDGEREYAAASAKRQHEHLAARFAAKEAVIKALGTGWTRGIAWKDVEVFREESGQPRVRLVGRAREIADEQGISGWHLSISHTGTQALASVLALAAQEEESAP